MLALTKEMNTHFLTTKKLLLEIWSFSKFYLFWILMHYISTNLYTYFCTPLSFVGFLASPFMAVSPHCKGLHWLFNVSVSTIGQMWMIFGIWLSAKLTGFFEGVPPPSPRQNKASSPMNYPFNHSEK